MTHCRWRAVHSGRRQRKPNEGRYSASHRRMVFLGSSAMEAGFHYQTRQCLSHDDRSGSPSFPLTNTTMSNHEPRLPPEILDSIIDILHDEPETLKNCILVSKSWVPRSRQYLFSDVTFRSPLDIEGWKKTFRDPASSPACHSHSLSVRYTGWVTDADTREGGWIHTFANVVRLELWSTTKVWLHLGEPLEPYHNFPSINLRSLRVVSHTLWPIQISNLVHTLPFLEDLAIINNGKVDFSYRNGTAPPESLPSTSPPLTGTLYIHRLQKYILRRLVELPNGLHFRGFTCSGCTYEDLEWVTTLVEKCSGTIECVDVDCQIIGMSLSAGVYDKFGL